MAEEHGFETQESHRLCANNCGFFGSPTTLNMCSKCYRDHRLKEEQSSSVKIAVEKSLASPSTTTQTLMLASTAVSIPVVDHRSPIVLATASSSDLPIPEISMQPNRCSTCRKRVGLTGFRCRCGIMFCTSHRYPEQHGCSFDFKGVGKEAIAKANPVVKADKLQKI